MVSQMKDISSKGRSRQFRLIDIISFIYLSFILIGSLSQSYMYIATGLFFVWLFVLLFSYLSSVKRIVHDRKTVLLVFYLIVAFFYGINSAPLEHCLKVFMEALMMFSPFMIFDHYKKNTASLPILLSLLLVAWVGVSIAMLEFYNTIGNLYGDFYGEGAARVVVSDKEAFGGMILGGGYSIAYGGALFVCVIVNMFLDKYLPSFIEKLIAVIVMITTLMLVLKTESTITTISMVVGVIVTIIYRDNAKAGTSKIFLLFGIIFFLICAKSIGKFLIEQSANLEGVVSQRIASFGASLAGSGGGDSDYTKMRFLIPFQSLGVFLESPIIGVSYLHGNGFVSPEVFGVGNHSEWCDALADYGLLGGVPYLLIYFLQVKEIKRMGLKFSIGWAVCLFLLGFFNPFRGFQSHIMLFFMIPAIKLLYFNRLNNI